MGLTIELNRDLAQAVEEAAQREGLSPVALVESAVRTRIGLPQPERAGREKAILAAIGAGLPEPVWARYRELTARRRAEALTPGEHEELIRLSDQVEEWHARRVALVAELAGLRNEPFPELMTRLGLASGAGA